VKIDTKLTSLGAQFRAVDGRLRGGDGVDPVKVAEFRSAIAEGRLQIEPGVIADRLFETVRESLRGQPESS
jgi:anti-sigma28 factor (negative regulator of flagellin synthesis)